MCFRAPCYCAGDVAAPGGLSPAPLSAAVQPSFGSSLVQQVITAAIVAVVLRYMFK